MQDDSQLVGSHPGSVTPPLCCPRPPPSPPQQDAQGPPQPDPDPLEQKLLRECEEALRGRPPRFHRHLVHCGDGQRGPGGPGGPIRVLQWNILAQGESPH